MVSKSKPENWAPTRDHMPQPGVSGSEEWGKKMSGGTVNLISPKTSDVKKESNSNSKKSKRQIRFFFLKR